jgi:hypothetical protein
LQWLVSTEFKETYHGKSWKLLHSLLLSAHCQTPGFYIGAQCGWGAVQILVWQISRLVIIGFVSTYPEAVHLAQHRVTIQRSGGEAFLPGWESILSSAISAERQSLWNDDFSAFSEVVTFSKWLSNCKQSVSVTNWTLRHFYFKKNNCGARLRCFFVVSEKKWICKHTQLYLLALACSFNLSFISLKRKP